MSIKIIFFSLFILSVLSAAEGELRPRALTVERSLDDNMITFRCPGSPGELIFVKVPIQKDAVILGDKNGDDNEEEFGYTPFGTFWIASRELPVTVWKWCMPVPFMDLRTSDPEWIDEYKPMSILSIQQAQKWIDIFNDALAESNLHFAAEIPFETDWEYSAVSLLGKHPDLSNFAHIGAAPRGTNHSYDIDMLNSPSTEFKGTFDFLGGLKELTRFCARSPEDAKRVIFKGKNGEYIELHAVKKGGSVADPKEALRFSKREFNTEKSIIHEAGLRLLLRGN